MTQKTGRSKIRKVLLTDRSPNDLAAIRLYSIEQWGRRTANKYLAQTESALSLIQTNPGLLRQEENFHRFLQFYRVNQHVLAFDIQESDIILLTVFHGSMDIPSRLAELEPALSAEVEFLHRKFQSR